MYGCCKSSCGARAAWFDAAGFASAWLAPLHAFDVAGARHQRTICSYSLLHRSQSEIRGPADLALAASRAKPAVVVPFKTLHLLLNSFYCNKAIIEACRCLSLIKLPLSC